MWIPRDIEPRLQRSARTRPVVVLTGARQTGKTSTFRRLFPDHKFVSLDLPTEAEQAEKEPQGFLRRHPPPVIIDEVQYAPGLFRYLKVAVDATQNAVPTILAYDRDSAGFVIGEKARHIAEGFRPVVQDFKLVVGESDPMFEGRFGSRGVRPQRLWEVRPEAAERDQSISTKQALRLFLQEFFKHIGDVPEQLIIGVPSTTNESWLRQYRTHVSQVLAELGHPDPQFFPEPFAVFQYYRDEGLIPAPGRPLTILVIDFGGGTLDSCVIETTPEGNLARGGSTSVPLGIHSVVDLTGSAV